MVELITLPVWLDGVAKSSTTRPTGRSEQPGLARRSVQGCEGPLWGKR